MKLGKLSFSQHPKKPFLFLLHVHYHRRIGSQPTIVKQSPSHIMPSRRHRICCKVS